MGRYCGYLALMSGLATGAERVYLHEKGLALRDREADLTNMIKGFQEGKRLSLVIRNELANRLNSTGFICALFEQENQNLFDVRQAILGHLQQVGNPSPFDRIQATLLAARCVEFLVDEAGKGSCGAALIGLQGGHLKILNLEDMSRLADAAHLRPKEQWWLDLRPIAHLMA